MLFSFSFSNYDYVYPTSIKGGISGTTGYSIHVYNYKNTTGLRNPTVHPLLWRCSVSPQSARWLVALHTTTQSRCHRSQGNVSVIHLLAGLMNRHWTLAQVDTVDASAEAIPKSPPTLPRAKLPLLSAVWRRRPPRNPTLPPACVRTHRQLCPHTTSVSSCAPNARRCCGRSTAA